MFSATVESVDSAAQCAWVGVMGGALVAGILKNVVGGMDFLTSGGAWCRIRVSSAVLGHCWRERRDSETLVLCLTNQDEENWCLLAAGLNDCWCCCINGAGRPCA